MKKGRLIVISGPSGSGKTTICNRLRNMLPEFVYSVSFTTRAPRRGEKDGKHYFFISEKQFKEMVKTGRFLEHAEVFGHYYGTGRDWVGENVNTGKNILLSLDVQGAMQIKKNFPEAVLIFLVPPSLKVLEERLKRRATDDPREIARRLAKSKEEMSYIANYDHSVINDKVEDAVEKIKAIVK